jgi:hypothetical protein
VGQKISTTDSPSHHVEHHDIYEQENFAGKLLLVLQTWAMLYAKFAAISSANMVKKNKVCQDPLHLIHCLPITTMQHQDQAANLLDEDIKLWLRLLNFLPNLHINKSLKESAKTVDFARISCYSCESESSRASFSGMVAGRDICRTNPLPPNKGLM